MIRSRACRAHHARNLASARTTTSSHSATGANAAASLVSGCCPQGVAVAARRCIPAQVAIGDCSLAVCTSIGGDHNSPVPSRRQRRLARRLWPALATHIAQGTVRRTCFSRDSIAAAAATAFARLVVVGAGCPGCTVGTRRRRARASVARVTRTRTAPKSSVTIATFGATVAVCRVCTTSCRVRHHCQIAQPHVRGFCAHQCQGSRDRLVGCRGR